MDDNTKRDDNSILIIGAGFAGLSAGIYAQMNGYHAQIFEMGDQPGGLCTAWKRKGYTIDGCIHWLVGSSPKSGMNRFWQEVGVVQGLTFVNADRYAHYESADGRTFVLYSNVDRLEKHMLELSPQDAELTKEFIGGVRLGIAFDNGQPNGSESKLGRLLKMAKFYLMMASRGKDMQKWMKITAKEFCSRFKDPLIREGLLEAWLPDFSMLFLLFTLSYMHNQNAGYPIGGSMPMSLALERRFCSLGGQIHYRSKVAKIMVENDRAVGLRLANGREVRGGRVISAADGRTTIFDMLEGKYVDEKVREPYEKWSIFEPLLFIGLGIKRTFEDVPQSVSGFTFALKEPVEIAGKFVKRLPVHIFNQDPTLAPPGKTSVVVMMGSDYSYWKALAEDKAAYNEKKDQVARQIVSVLEQRFPGIGGQVEMVDVATPLTFERYTGNWQGTFEGWQITPQNAQTIMKPMKQTLPGLQHFYMCGQWVEPGGGLPTGVMSGRRLLQAICKEDGKKFVTTVA